MDEYCVLTTKVTAYNDIRLLIGAPWYAKAVQPSRTIPLMNFYLLSERPLLAVRRHSGSATSPDGCAVSPTGYLWLSWAFLLCAGLGWNEDDQIRLTYVDPRLRKQGSHLSTVMRLMIEEMHEQTIKVPVSGYSLHACVIEGVI